MFRPERNSGAASATKPVAAISVAPIAAIAASATNRHCYRRVAAVATVAARSSDAAISAKRRAAVAARSAAIIDQPIHEPLPEAGVKDVVTSTDQNSVAASATKRAAAIS